MIAVAFIAGVLVAAGAGLLALKRGWIIPRGP
jgi:hypothetical protein